MMMMTCCLGSEFPKRKTDIELFTDTLKESKSSSTSSIKMSVADRPDILSPADVDDFIESLEESKILELGTLPWIDKHERIKKLTIQAVIQVLSSREETVKEGLITHEKLPMLVHEIIMVELWREQVFPQILKISKKIGFSSYPILYHESACVNLLEVVMFHSEAAETLGDSAPDLTDYCLRSLNNLLAKHEPLVEDEEDKNGRKIPKHPTEDDIDIMHQSEILLTGTSVKALAVLRYIIENIQTLGNGLVSRLVVSSDTPMMLTEIILRKPWRKEYSKQGKIEDFDPLENNWKPIDPSARILINPKTELQAWLALFLLLKDNSILSVYELYDARKNNLLKLRPFLHEAALEQFPFLTEFSIFLNQLAVTSGPFGPSKAPLLLEVIPPIREYLEAKFEREKMMLIDFFLGELVYAKRELKLQKSRRLAQAYDFDQFMPAMPVINKCAKCNRDATKRCAKCKKAWYCCRECQVGHWKEHKPTCRSSD